MFDLTFKIYCVPPVIQSIITRDAHTKKPCFLSFSTADQNRPKHLNRCAIHVGKRDNIYIHKCEEWFGWFRTVVVKKENRAKESYYTSSQEILKTLQSALS